jgi:hypothetical protein
MTTVVYDISVPRGLFVPSLLSQEVLHLAFGQLCGHLFHKLDHTSGTFADSANVCLDGRWCGCFGWYGKDDNFVDCHPFRGNW